MRPDGTTAAAATRVDDHVHRSLAASDRARDAELHGSLPGRPDDRAERKPRPRGSAVAGTRSSDGRVFRSHRPGSPEVVPPTARLDPPRSRAVDGPRKEDEGLLEPQQRGGVEIVVRREVQRSARCCRNRLHRAVRIPVRPTRLEASQLRDSPGRQEKSLLRELPDVPMLQHRVALEEGSKRPDELGSVLAVPRAVDARAERLGARDDDVAGWAERDIRHRVRCVKDRTTIVEERGFQPCRAGWWPHLPRRQHRSRACRSCDRIANRRERPHGSVVTCRDGDYAGHADHRERLACRSNSLQPIVARVRNPAPPDGSTANV